VSEPKEEAPEVNVARLCVNGPIELHATIRMAGHPPMFRARLCRCGASKNKPFCDDSHVTSGFKDDADPAPESSEPLAVRGGELKVLLLTDGPLSMKGPLEVCSAAGRTVMVSGRVVTLCRCGGSSNKPYCDGSHAEREFSTE
jgi:CDGSH-type Zn-finger protein